MARPKTQTSVDRESAENADQTEWKAYLLGNTPIESGFDDNLAAGNTEEYSSEGAEASETFMESDRTKDNAGSSIHSEIGRRAKMLGSDYPFIIRGNNLLYIGNEELISHTVYTFLLAIANAKSIIAGEFVKLPREFELLCNDLVRWHYGYYAKSIHIGWPRSETDLPNHFERLAREYIMPQTGEWNWDPHPEADLTVLDYIKDGGLDFLVWLESPDGDKGKLFVTGQCACGDDWDSKYHDIDPEFKKLKKWFSKGVSWVDPVRVFGVPFCINGADRFDVTQQAGIFYDRLRLTLLCRALPYPFSPVINITSIVEAVEIVKNQ